MYNSKQKQLIHNLIEAVFSGDEFDQFCADNFPGIAERFTPKLDQAAKIQALIETCAQHQQLGNLVVKLQKAKPDEYQRFAQQQKSSSPKTEPESETPAQRSPAPPTITTFPIQPTADQAGSSTAARHTRGGEIILNAETMLNQSLAGRYRIEEILDKSGLGAVFKAFDTKLELPVAIKVIDLKRVKQTAIQERVKQEVRTAMQLDHPGIVKVYDFGQSDSILYIIMEYINGYNLRQARQYFKTLDGKMAMPQIIRLFREICLTVDYMHQQRVLHPGTKPENIMIKQSQPGEETSWRPVMINLGLMRPNTEMVMSHQDISSRRLTYTISPELLLGHGTDIRSDVYTLGALLYDLAAGEAPFRPNNISEAVRAHVETPPPPPRSINPSITTDLERVILKALAKKPADRFLSALDMAQALEECLDAATLPAPAPQSEMTVALEARATKVVPGESLNMQLTLNNRGKLEDHCQIRVEGMPDEWISISPSATTLAAGERQQVEIIIQPPRSPQSRAGRHTLAFQVISQYSAKPVDEIKRVLTIAPYYQFNSTIWPQEISTGQITQVTIDNHGNTAETFTLRPKAGKSITYSPQQARLKVDPGSSATADFRVTARRQLFVATQEMQTFSIDVLPPKPQPPQTLSGQVTSQGWLAPAWIFGGLLAIVLALIAALALLFTAGTLSTERSNAEATQSAQLALNTSATAVAATTTSRWQNEDSDGDGLTNQEEIDNDTNPDREDSDGDGLTDSEEVEIYQTNPNNPDSDEDTLPDGAEVQELNTNPNRLDSDFDGVPDRDEVQQILDSQNRDTDNDGTPDAFDENPRQPPTPTPEGTPVPTATPVVVTVSFSNPQPYLNQSFFFNQENQYYVYEDEGVALIQVELSEQVDRQIQVSYGVEVSNNAEENVDYRLDNNAVVYNPGDSLLKTIEVELIENPERTSDALIVLALSNPSPGVNLGLNRIELTIRNTN